MDGKLCYRFKDNPNRINEVDFYDIPPQVASHLTELVKEIKQKCLKYGLPMIRGVIVMGHEMRKNSAANIGDGVLFISYETLLIHYEKKGSPFYPKPESNWVRGMSRKLRPFISSQYFGSWEDIISALIWHEFGHHIHHTYLINLLDLTSLETYLLYRNKPPLEERILETNRSGRKNHLATRYGARRPLEWWAENYSLYTMGRNDLVSNSFFEIIADIESNNLTPFLTSSKALANLLNPKI